MEFGVTVPTWQATLRRLAQQFLTYSKDHHISTVVVHAPDTTAGRQALDGPPPDNVLRSCTGFGKNTLPCARVRIDTQDHPLRAIYFGGDSEAAKPFQELLKKVGELLDDERVAKLMSAPAILKPSALDEISRNPTDAVSWILFVHYLGLQGSHVTGITFEPLRWNEDSWVCLDDYASGEVQSDYFFTFSHNTFEDSAAAIDALLASPPRDGWVTIQEAAKALDLNEGHTRRLADEGKIIARGEGKQRRLSPRSVLDYLLEIRQSENKGEDTGRRTERSDRKLLHDFQQSLQPDVKHCPYCKLHLGRLGRNGHLYQCERCNRKFRIDQMV